MSVSNLKKLSQKEFTSYCKTEDVNVLLEIKVKCDDEYYNVQSDKKTSYELPDILYDILKETLLERMREKNPNYVFPVGCKVREGDNRVDLPFWLGSLETFTTKDEKKIYKWNEKNSSKFQIVSEKLDGMSGLLFIENGIRKLFGRGDGTVGADLSHLIRYLQFPKTLPDNLAVRGELIMVKDTFEKKYSTIYKNPRNMVGGLIGAKNVKIQEALSDIQFIAYEIVGEEKMDCPSEQRKTLKKMGFNVCKAERVGMLKSVEELETIHQKFKQETIFDIDGIVIQSDTQYDRNTSGDPSYMFAFKMRSLDNIAQTTVIDIEWEVSRLGSIIPVIVVETVDLPGVSVSRITGSNAGLLLERKIGIGSIVNVTRSKDVIPYILDVLTEGEIVYPKHISYKWDKTKVNLLANKNDPNVRKNMKIKQYAHFFGSMNIKHISEATVRKLYECGYDTLVKIVSASKEDLLSKGFGEKTVVRMLTNISTGLKNVDTALLISSSGVLGMGIGTKRITELLNNIPDLLSGTAVSENNTLKKRILNIEGFSEIMAEKVLTHLPDAIQFIDEISPFLDFKYDTRVDDTLLDTKFVFSGFRSKELEQYIVDRGGKITSAVSKKTTGLIVSSKTEHSVKVENATKFKIPIYTKEEFLSVYE
jgi:NAD-dependent DNA ligase